MNRPQIRKHIYAALAHWLEQDLAAEADWVRALYAGDDGDPAEASYAARRRVQVEGRALVEQLRRKSGASE